MSTPAEQLAAALRSMPDEDFMVQHDYERGGYLLSCCGGEVREVWGGDDKLVHKADCWFMGARATLAAYDAAQQSATRAPAGDHTAEPWSVGERDAATVWSTDNKGAVCTTNDSRYVLREEASANARRIVACVNACAGIPTGRLEGARLLPMIPGAVASFVLEREG